jgi:hypothetical protein
LLIGVEIDRRREVGRCRKRDASRDLGHSGLGIRDLDRWRVLIQDECSPPRSPEAWRAELLTDSVSHLSEHRGA